MGNSVGRRRAASELRSLIRQNWRDPKLERLFEETYLGKHKLRVNGEYFPSLARQAHHWRDDCELPSAEELGLSKFRRPLLNFRFLPDGGEIWPTRLGAGSLPAFSTSAVSSASSASSLASSSGEASSKDSSERSSEALLTQPDSPVLHAAEVLRRNFTNFVEDYNNIGRVWFRDRNIDTSMTVGSWKKLPVLSYQRWHADAEWTNAARILREEMEEGVLAKGLGRLALRKCRLL